MINYFGILLDTSKIKLDDKIVIEDNVFLYDFSNINNYKNWFAFNSFRKITTVSDGSLIKTNLKNFYSTPYILQNEANFVQLKYQAKNKKYNYLFNHIGEEYQYLDDFNKGENILNNQKNIYTISDRSKYELLKFDNANSQKKSKIYYKLLFDNFGEFCLNNDVNFYSYFVMKIKKRDELRSFLMTKNIFLPVHWPKSVVKNNLYDNIISIPIFSIYSLSDIKRVIKNIVLFKIDYV